MVAGLVAMATVVVAPGSQAGAASSTLLSIGTGYQVTSLNPFVAVESSSLAVFKYTYPSLVQYNTKLGIVSNFATNWSHDKSGLTWTFNLHSNAKWSDGKPLNASDVAWTINTVLKDASGGGAQMATYLQGVKSASAKSPDKVVLHLGTPEAALLANLATMPILPKHVWKKYANGKEGANLRTFSNTPSSGRPDVDGGPFTCVKYTVNGVSLFQANPNYYGKKPSISGFGLEYFSSATAMVAALKQGKVDAILNAPPSAISTLKADKSLEVDTKSAFNDSDFFINDYTKKKSNRELLNPLVHQAFNVAIDRQSIAKIAFNGDARPAMSPIPLADTGWHDPSITPPQFTLTKANSLLTQAGYKMGPNGVRVASGHPMAYTVILATDELGPRTRAFDIIQSDFAKIGVKLTVKVTDDSTAATLELAPSTKFDLAMWGWTPPGPDPTFMLNTYTCAQWGGWSETAYCNHSFDKLFHQQSTTLKVAKRRAIVYQMQQMLAKTLPEYIYVYENVNDAWNKHWSGFGETPDGLFTALTTYGITKVHPS